MPDSVSHPLSSRSEEGLARNSVLIRELNANLAKVVEHYRALSAKSAPLQ